MCAGCKVCCLSVLLIFTLLLHGICRSPAVIMQIVKSIVGQSVFQLGVMYALVYHADAIFGVPKAGLMDGPSVHYTLVFNTFVLMQLFNQVIRVADTCSQSNPSCELEGCLAVCMGVCMPGHIHAMSAFQTQSLLVTGGGALKHPELFDVECACT